MKRGYADKHVKAKQNKKRIRILWVTISHILEQVCVCMSSAYVCGLDHAYADPYSETLINTEIEQKTKT